MSNEQSGFDSDPRVLVFYSNPHDTTRLRLDKEHRAVEEILRRHHLPVSTVHRVHAASVDDFARALWEADYEIIQFSGHGSPAGIYLERGDAEGGTHIGAGQLAAILRGARPSLRAVMFLSCFSAGAIDTLIEVAPFVITVSGSADDTAAILWITAFYNRFFQTRSIEQAFFAAQCHLEFSRKDTLLSPVLSRRARVLGKDRLLVQAFPGLRSDSILVDITEAEDDIRRLGVPRDHFLSILSRKIRTHHWSYQSSRDNAIIPVGRWFGVFSWTNHNDVVFCHRILCLKPNIDDSTCEAWASLILHYNQAAQLPYRNVMQPAEEANRPLLKTALETMSSAMRIFEQDKSSIPLRQVAPEEFRIARSFFSANLDQAQSHFEAHHGRDTIACLEAALSALHDLLDAVAAAVTQAPAEPTAA